MTVAARRLASDQLRFPLLRETAEDRASFIVGDSNRSAVESLDAWPDGAAGRVVALVGPPGSGKSHLAAAWAERNGAVALSGFEASLADLSDLEGRPILLDDADKADDAALFHLMNLAQSPGGSLLMVSREPPPLWETPLPDLRSRLDATRVLRLDAPDDTVLDGVLRRLFEARAIRPADDLVAYLVRRIERYVPAARLVVERLDAEAGGRPVNRHLAREILDDATDDLFA